MITIKPMSRSSSTAPGMVGIPRNRGITGDCSPANNGAWRSRSTCTCKGTGGVSGILATLWRMDGGDSVFTPAGRFSSSRGVSTSSSITIVTREGASSSLPVVTTTPGVGSDPAATSDAATAAGSSVSAAAPPASEVVLLVWAATAVSSATNFSKRARHRGRCTVASPSQAGQCSVRPCFSNIDRVIYILRLPSGPKSCCEVILQLVRNACPRGVLERRRWPLC